MDAVRPARLMVAGQQVMAGPARGFVAAGIMADARRLSASQKRIWLPNSSGLYLRGRRGRFESGRFDDRDVFGGRVRGPFCGVQSGPG